MVFSGSETMFVITSLHGGGAERLLANMLAKHAAPARVSVVSLLPGGVFRPVLERAGIRVTDLGMTRKTHFLRGVIKLAAMIRAARPAIVQGWMYDANLVAFLALLLAGRRNTRLFWATFCTDMTGENADWAFRLVRRCNAWLSSRVDGVVYNAKEALDFHHEIGFREPRSAIITNVIDQDVFRFDESKRNAVRAQLGIRDDDVVVTVVARVDPMKDWRSVQDAVRGLPGVVTIAAGKGTDALPAQEGFIGLGWRDDVTAILSAADIFLLGSAFGEGASLSLCEAMACGLPSVVTNVGGNAALLGDGGIVVEPRNAVQMREAIVRLAHDAALREELGRVAYERATAAWSDSGRDLHLHAAEARR